jgi:hypothetical protein
MPGIQALDRDALYYPFIHITDVNWLKATLLSFPHVRRMVPGNYTPNDSRAVREFCEVMGPRKEPLLDSVNLFSPGAVRAEMNLLEKLQANDVFIRSRYSKKRTAQQYPNPADHFRMHDEKIIHFLYAHLTGGPEEDALAWRTAAPEDRPHRASGGWFALHPDLGSAILSIIAIAIAKEFGLDIVTDSSSIHHTVVTRNEDEIFDELIGQPAPSHAPPTHDTLDDLSEIVITTNFDVTRLSASQIAELLADGKDLRRFKDALIPFVASIPPIEDPQEREKRLRAAAEEVIAEWGKYRKSLPKFALDAIFDVTELKWPDLAFATILGGGTTWGIGAQAGLGITLVSYAGLKIWRKYKQVASSPYGYLNRVAKAQSKSQSSLFLAPFI